MTIENRKLERKMKKVTMLIRREVEQWALERGIEGHSFYEGKNGKIGDGVNWEVVRKENTKEKG